MDAKQQLLSTIGVRSFFASETMSVLRTCSLWVATWGARDFTQVPCKQYANECTALFFRVSGRNHKGYVVISLDASDTYTVTLVNLKWEVKETIEMVYVDMLCDTIDRKVERQNNYKS